MTGGIVCEYNPFHNGHKYHLEKVKAQGTDITVCVMSGNLVQRGECAVTDKWQRAVCAVKGGADVVIDLPVPWAMASAENFARGSISLLSSFGIDMLSFGSETEDEKLLTSCREAQENEKVAALVKKYMAEGLSYPSALSEGIGEVFGEKVKSALCAPNSTLAAEYIRQLKVYSPQCSIFPVKRVHTDHDSPETEGNFASASKIRSIIGEDVSSFVPVFTAEMLKENIEKGTVHSLGFAERAILSSLREMPKEQYGLYVTDESGLVSRIYESVKNASDLTELYEKAKSKNYTHARIRREVMNLYLRIPKEICRKTPPYIKILAVNDRGLSVLSKVKKNSALPIVTKHSDTAKLSEYGKQIYSLQCASTDKFSIMSEKVMPCGLEQKNSMIIVNTL